MKLLNHLFFISRLFATNNRHRQILSQSPAILIQEHTNMEFPDNKTIAFFPRSVRCRSDNRIAISRINCLCLSLGDIVESWHCWSIRRRLVDFWLGFEPISGTSWELPHETWCKLKKIPLKEYSDHLLVRMTLKMVDSAAGHEDTATSATNATTTPVFIRYERLPILLSRSYLPIGDKANSYAIFINKYMFASWCSRVLRVLLAPPPWATDRGRISSAKAIESFHVRLTCRNDRTRDLSKWLLDLVSAGGWRLRLDRRSSEEPWNFSIRQARFSPERLQTSSPEHATIDPVFVGIREPDFEVNSRLFARGLFGLRLIRARLFISRIC